MFEYKNDHFDLDEMSWNDWKEFLLSIGKEPVKGHLDQSGE